MKATRTAAAKRQRSSSRPPDALESSHSSSGRGRGRGSRDSNSSDGGEGASICPSEESTEAAYSAVSVQPCAAENSSSSSSSVGRVLPLPRASSYKSTGRSSRRSFPSAVASSSAAVGYTSLSVADSSASAAASSSVGRRAAEPEQDGDAGCMRLWWRRMRVVGKGAAAIFAPQVAETATAAYTVNLTWLFAGLHGAADQLLPAAYKALEKELLLSPSFLGAASSASRMAHALACPVWGLLVDYLDAAADTGAAGSSSSGGRTPRRATSGRKTGVRRSSSSGRPAVAAGRGGRSSGSSSEKESGLRSSCSPVAAVGGRRWSSGSETSGSTTDGIERGRSSSSKPAYRRLATTSNSSSNSRTRRRRSCRSVSSSCRRLWQRWVRALAAREDETGLALLRMTGAACGAAAVLLACAQQPWQLMPLMLLSGFFMAAMGPLSQKLLAHAVPQQHRGTAFGAMSFFQSFGRMSALLLTTGLSGLLLLGVAGWRVAFCFVGLLSLALAVALPTPRSSGSAAAREDEAENAEGEAEEEDADEQQTDLKLVDLESGCHSSAAVAASSSSARGGGAAAAAEAAPPAAGGGTVRSAEGRFPCIRNWCRRQGAHFSSLLYVFKSSSFWAMLVLGVLNGVPRSALNFIVMFFQYCGLKDWEASITVAVSWITAMLVSPSVGRVSDAVHRRYPLRGRPVLAQASILIRALLMLLLLAAVPQRRESFLLFLFLSAVIGLLAGWPGVGVNRPILSEVALPPHRATVYSLFATMEGVGAALLGAPVVGMLAEDVFGYQKLTKFQRTALTTDATAAAGAAGEGGGGEGAAGAAAAGVSGGGTGAKTVFSKEERGLVNTVDVGVRESNARALSAALLCTTVGPWLLAVAVYFVLHWTYSADRKLPQEASCSTAEEEELEERRAIAVPAGEENMEEAQQEEDEKEEEEDEEESEEEATAEEEEDDAAAGTPGGRTALPAAYRQQQQQQYPRRKKSRQRRQQEFWQQEEQHQHDRQRTSGSSSRRGHKPNSSREATTVAVEMQCKSAGLSTSQKRRGFDLEEEEDAELLAAPSSSGVRSSHSSRPANI